MVKMPYRLWKLCIPMWTPAVWNIHSCAVWTQASPWPSLASAPDFNKGVFGLGKPKGLGALLLQKWFLHYDGSFKAHVPHPLRTSPTSQWLWQPY